MVSSKCGSVLCLASMFFLCAAAALAFDNPCDPTYVQQKGMGITVLPTDGDDTANLRCAIDYAVTLGPGVTVQLLDHTYKTEQLVLQGFRGTIRGAGMTKTVVRNSDLPMPIQNPITFPEYLPSLANPYPTLISVVGDDIVLADLSVHIVGPNPTAGWYWAGGGPYYFVVPALAVVGSNTTLQARRIEIAGSDKCPFDPEGNLLADIEFWNFFSGTLPWPSSSTLVVEDSVFKSCGGIIGYDILNSKVVVTGSRFYTPWYGVAVSDMGNSSVEVSHNEFNGSSNPADAPVGVDVWAGNYGTGIRDSSILIRNNRFSGVYGVLLEANWVTPDPNDPTFYGAIDCSIVGNNVQRVSGYGYWFQPGTYGCTVVGQGKGTVQDDTGGAHTIVGVTPHTGGVGHAISKMVRRGGPWR